MDGQKTLYVTDMDGTLLDNESRVSDRSAAILTGLSRRGALVTVATARTPATVQPLLHAVESRCPAIVMTGASMWDRGDERYVNPRLLDRSTAATVLDAFERHAILPFVYTLGDGGKLDVYHDTAMNRHEKDFYYTRRHLTLKKFHIGELVPDHSLGCNILNFAIGKSSLVEPLAEWLRENVDCSVSCYPDINSRDTSLIEVFAPGVSKAAAVEQLKAMTGASRLVVFGDNLNDLPMMAVADVAVAVDNAFPEVKERADIVIGRNSADSVARFIADDYDNN